MNTPIAFQNINLHIVSRKSCRVCDNDDFEIILDFGDQPLAGRYLLPNERELIDEPYYPLSIHFCRNCGMVQNLKVIPPEILYSQYLFSSRTIQPLIRHFEEYALWLKNRFDPKTVVEFGCNDGVLLLPLSRLGIESCGVDLSENITALARMEGLNVITGSFDRTIAERIFRQYGMVDIVTGSNVFAHVDDPREILEASRFLLKPGGHLCLEFMYAGDLYENLQWDSMYHEHLCFYSLRTLTTLLNRYGFKVVDVERSSMHAGSLRVVATPNFNENVTANISRLTEYEDSIGLHRLESWKDFNNSVTRNIDLVTRVIFGIGRSSRIWAYGAAGRASMWLNACKLNYLEAMVDSSPFRIGRLMPGTHTPIVDPTSMRGDPPEYVLITAWNYSNDILQKENWFKGNWILPSPFLKFI